VTILRERVSWTRPIFQKETYRASILTPEEQANVKAALRFLAKRIGSLTKLAQAMKVNLRTLQTALGRQRPTVGVALRAARVAGVALEDILAGRWPPAGLCPYCGERVQTRILMV
jgi:hypothetical protein